jgi:hypothetical protein
VVFSHCQIPAEFGVIGAQGRIVGLGERRNRFAKTCLVAPLCSQQAAQKLGLGHDPGLRLGGTGQELLADVPGCRHLPGAVQDGGFQQQQVRWHPLRRPR